MMNLKLGQKVIVTGRLQEKQTNFYKVEKQKESILRRGSTGLSQKYETVLFDEIEKSGIIVGKRSVVKARRHSRAFNPYRGEYFVDTHTTRQTVYLVACDLRGIFMVPYDCITEVFEEYSTSSNSHCEGCLCGEEDDFYELDEDDFDEVI